MLPRLQQPIGPARWGHHGGPVLVFPTAGGDAEEIERNGLVGACWPLIESGRVEVCSCDSVAGRAGLGDAELPIVVAGASIGAFHAVAVLCRFPEVFRAAVAMSGTYRLQRLLDGGFPDHLHLSSPLDLLPGLDGSPLDTLRQRFVLLASGQEEWQDVGEAWAMADVLGCKGVPNRVDPWGTEWPHEWHTWQRMLPQYLGELC